MNRTSRIADRYRALLRVNKLARSTSTIDQTFQSMCHTLRRFLQFDRAVLSLYDAESDSLRIEALYGAHKTSFLQLGSLFPGDFGRSGRIRQRKTARICRDLSRGFRVPSERQALAEGYRSLCSVPLIARDEGIGVLTVAGARTNQFSRRDCQLVQEISNQIIMTIVSQVAHCPVHPDTKLLCPKCIGAIGGRATVTKYHGALSSWGKKGGRGRKKIKLS